MAVRIGQQLLVPPYLAHAAIVEHDDRIGPADRREAVRNDEGGAVQHQLRQRILHQQLGLRIQG